MEGACAGKNVKSFYATRTGLRVGIAVACLLRSLGISLVHVASSAVVLNPLIINQMDNPR